MVAPVVLVWVFALGAVPAVFVLVVPEALVLEADAVLVLVVADFAGCWLTGVVLAGALLAELTGAGVSFGFGVFVDVVGVLVLAAEPVAALTEVLVVAVGAFLFVAVAVLADVVVLTAGFGVAALPEVIVVLVAVGVALTGEVTEELPALTLGGDVLALCPTLVVEGVPLATFVVAVCGEAEAIREGGGGLWMSRGLGARVRLTTGAGPTEAGAAGRALARAWAVAAAVAAAPAGKAQVAAVLNSGSFSASVAANWELAGVSGPFCPEGRPLSNVSGAEVDAT